MRKISEKSLQRLFESIIGIESVDELRRFMVDLCTVNEVQAMAQRLDTAILLDEGKSYLEIVDLIGASTATISRVSKSLNYGEGGYEKVLERIREKESEDGSKRL